MMIGSALTLKGGVNGMVLDILVCFLASALPRKWAQIRAGNLIWGFREFKGEEIFQWDNS